MAAAAETLREAVRAGDVERARHLLAAAPNHAAALVADPADEGRNALHFAVDRETADLELVSLLAAACPAAAADRNNWGFTALHWAARRGHTDAVRLLLTMFPSAAPVRTTGLFSGYTVLQFAAADGNEDMVQLLLEAAPTSAAVEAEGHISALDLCCQAHPWHDHHCRTARLLIAAPGQQPGRLLQSLNSGLPVSMPLFADVATRCPLSPANWLLVPFPCPGLTAALPAVLQRSTVEAALLVPRLPLAERRRLRTAAIALHRAQQRSQAWLPQPLAWRILAACLA